MTPPTKTEQIRSLHKKTQESLQAARELLEKEHEEFAISRAYYAMFYITEALLLTKDLAFSKHSAVIAAFGQHFIKPGTFKQELREMLTQAFEDRTESDYGMTESFSIQEAQEAIERAESYCDTLNTYFQKSNLL